MIQTHMGFRPTGPANLNTSSSSQPPAKKNDAPLSDEQVQLVSETLSLFDPSELSQSDAMSIVETFAEAGIEPGRGLEEAMKEADFDAKTVGELAGVGPQEQGPPPPPPQTSISSQMLDFLSEQLDKYGEGELSEENKISIMSAMQEEFGLEQSDYLLDVQA